MAMHIPKPSGFAQMMKDGAKVRDFVIFLFAKKANAYIVIHILL